MFMKGFRVVIFFLIPFLPRAGGLLAQQAHFLFIQDEAKRPFYVRVGEQSFSSSAYGHIIMAPLRDTAFSFFIGFPKARYPEQQFRLEIAGKDLGFELKQIGGAWRLFDLRSLRLIEPQNAGRDMLSQTRRTDSYSQLMAGLVEDSAVLYYAPGADSLQNDSSVAGRPVEVRADTAVGKPVAVRADTVAEKPVVVRADTATGRQVVAMDRKKVVAHDTLSRAADTVERAVIQEVADVRRGDTAVVVAKRPPVVSEGLSGISGQEAGGKPAIHYDRRDIIRFSTENVVEGKLIIYHDRSGPVTDTIRILIPRL